MANVTFRAKTVASKMVKYQILNASALTRDHLLETVTFSVEKINKMLAKHTVIYIKPESGTYGRDIFSVSTVKGSYKVRQYEQSIIFQDFTSMAKYVQEIVKSKRRFIIQQGISPLEYDGKHVDLRVLFHRPNASWIFSGLGVKVAKSKEMIVTNFNQGAAIISFNEYLSDYLTHTQIDLLKSKIEFLCLEGCKTLSYVYPRFRQLGFDIAIDKNFKPWIIEVNTKPKYQLFRELDINVYNKIDFYHSQIEKQYRKEKRVVKKPIKYQHSSRRHEYTKS